MGVAVGVALGVALGVGVGVGVALGVTLGVGVGVGVALGVALGVGVGVGVGPAPYVRPNASCRDEANTQLCPWRTAVLTNRPKRLGMVGLSHTTLSYVGASR
jgi:hypothetical protein